MPHTSLRAVMCGLLLTCPPMLFAQNNQALVARGRYLVTQVAKCGDCHTPHVQGAPDATRLLKGAPLGFKPLGPVPHWSAAAPDLTPTSPLWKTWNQEAAVSFFVSGKMPDGHTPAPPMPSYTLAKPDAQAIVAYLKSLP